MSKFLNDGSNDAPKLRVFLNLDNLADLRPGGLWPGLEGAARFRKLAEDGFEGVQLTTNQPPPNELDLPFCGLDRINSPDDADGIAARHKDRGDLCLTVHAGWGIEEEADSFKLVEAILRASEKYSLPIFIETHRATITQDMWRTVQITKQFPEVLFNGDFSHYYCGQEMVYGGLEMKLAFMKPIFDRIGFMHGRIASPGCMQVPIDPDFDSRPRQAHGMVNYLEDFKAMWTRAMAGFLKNAKRGDVLIFAPELLAGSHYYARMISSEKDSLIEEADRYSQANLYKQMAKICFTKALTV